jgi:hypothetical protein
MKEDKRLVAPNKSNVDWCIVRTAFPILFRTLDELTIDDAVQTNSYAGHRLTELRMTLATIAGSLGFVGLDAIEQLRRWMEIQNGTRCEWCGDRITSEDHSRSHD